MVIPVYRPRPEHLRACVASVRAQTWPKWQLLLRDDGSDDDETLSLLAELAGEGDHRVSLSGHSVNAGISITTNAAAAMATGDFLAFVDQDDVLEPTAFGRIVGAVMATPNADVIYTDQDVLSEEGVRIEPYFKPGWSPDLLLSNMYLGHLLVVRRSLFESLGGLRPQFDGSQDYDLALRATERARAVVHIPAVAYHWRRSEGSTASSYDAKPTATLAAVAALEDSLRRRGLVGTVEPGLLQSTFRVRRQHSGEFRLVVAIPVEADADDLRRCVDQLESLDSSDSSIELRVALIEGTTSTVVPEVRAMVEHLQRRPHVRRCPTLEPEGAEFVLFLAPWLRPTVGGWITSMAEQARRYEVGAVGARIVDKDGLLVHAGIVPGLAGRRHGSIFRGCPPNNSGYWGHSRMVRNWSAVSGACLMTRVDVLAEVGGWPASLPLALAGVDYCERLTRTGRLVVYTPFAEFAMVAEERDPSAFSLEDVAPLSTAVADPYFNPNLDPTAVEVRLPQGYSPSSGARNWPV